MSAKPVHKTCKMGKAWLDFLLEVYYDCFTTQWRVRKFPFGHASFLKKMLLMLWSMPTLLYWCNYHSDFSRKMRLLNEKHITHWIDPLLHNHDGMLAMFKFEFLFISFLIQNSFLKRLTLNKKLISLKLQNNLLANILIDVFCSRFLVRNSYFIIHKLWKCKKSIRHEHKKLIIKKHLCP